MSIPCYCLYHFSNRWCYYSSFRTYPRNRGGLRLRSPLLRLADGSFLRQSLCEASLIKPSSVLLAATGNHRGMLRCITRFLLGSFETPANSVLVASTSATGIARPSPPLSSSPLSAQKYPTDDNIALSTSASIAPRFKPRQAPSKMVDFCVHIMPDDAEKYAIDAVRRMRPASSINHTDWGHLTSRPIVLSIETKLDGEDLTTAITQIATWQAAHWRSLVFEKTSLPDIDFLPGLVVQGHQWYFVATTRDPASGKAHIYLKMLVGSTDTIIGAYQALLCLKCLKDFATEEYWPAFKSYMLPLS